MLVRMNWWRRLEAGSYRVRCARLMIMPMNVSCAAAVPVRVRMPLQHRNPAALGRVKRVVVGVYRMLAVMSVVVMLVLGEAVR